MMDVQYKDNIMILKVDAVFMIAMEKVYLKQFDGATVKFLSGQEGDRLVISAKE
ncbi:MAG: hypothetical protein KAJ33_02755 [Thermoplasmata archaeon]|nr:hypothetical protein [Thermoplasmata archaeon]